jgi:hypothetical protein
MKTAATRTSRPLLENQTRINHAELAAHSVADAPSMVGTAAIPFIGYDLTPY